MLEWTAARRYAEAFVNVLPGSQAPRALEDLKRAAAAYADCRDLRRFLGSPEIAPEQKRKLLERIWSGSVEARVLELLKLLLRRDRMEDLPAVAESAAAVWEARQGVVRGRAVTAHPISDAETQAVARALSARLGKRVVLERSVDPAVLGGIRVQVGTTLVDGSVVRQLNDLREELKSVKVNR